MSSTITIKFRDLSRVALLRLSKQYGDRPRDIRRYGLRVPRPTSHEGVRRFKAEFGFVPS